MIVSQPHREYFGNSLKWPEKEKTLPHFVQPAPLFPGLKTVEPQGHDAGASDRLQDLEDEVDKLQRGENNDEPLAANKRNGPGMEPSVKVFRIPARFWPACAGVLADALSHLQIVTRTSIDVEDDDSDTAYRRLVLTGHGKGFADASLEIDRIITGIHLKCPGKFTS